MDFEAIREKERKHYNDASLNEPFEIDILTNDEILRLTEELDFVENPNDDTIEGIPAPIFIDLFT